MQVLLGHSEYGEDQEEALVRTALSWAPAAVVLTGLSHSSETRKLLQASGVPVVEMWELGARADRHGGRVLAPAGGRVGRPASPVEGSPRARLHRRAHAGGSPRREARERLCRRRLARREILSCEIINHPGAATVEAGSLLLNRALQQIPKLDGIACSNDLIALGALFECQRRGIAVPHDIAVVGFGDLDFSASCIPSLTTIRPSGDLIGREVARLILSSIQGERPEGNARIIDTGHVLIERRST